MMMTHFKLASRWRVLVVYIALFLALLGFGMPSAAGQAVALVADVEGRVAGRAPITSRALLVTHWPVETRSARQLVTTLFERYAADPKLSRAEALRQASLAVMEDSAKDASGKPLFSYAHPLFWAPYALVGDGGR
jgi:hypothetical protein